MTEFSFWDGLSQPASCFMPFLCALFSIILGVKTVKATNVAAHCYIVVEISVWWFCMLGGDL